jgi:hypothetical protein
LAKKVAINSENISGILLFLNKTYLLVQKSITVPTRAIGIECGIKGE